MNYSNKFAVSRDGLVPFVGDAGLGEYEIKIIGVCDMPEIHFSASITATMMPIWLRGGQDTTLDLLCQAMYIGNGCGIAEIRVNPGMLRKIEKREREVPLEGQR